MLSSRSTVILGRGITRCLGTTTRRALSSHDFHPNHHAPRPAVELDPGLLELLNESGDSLKGLKQKSHAHPNPPAELHVYDDLQASQSTEVARLEEGEDAEFDAREERRSPAAVFGSDRPAHIKLSEELRKAIQALVDKSDKHQLRSDAKRLFLNPAPSNNQELRWETNSPAYGSKLKERKMAERNGLAYATVAMPAHYAVIEGVLQEIKSRGTPDTQPFDQPMTVIDFGSKYGAGLWAARSALPDVKYYNGRRSQILSNPTQTVAICAFTLSELNTDKDRAQMLREIWDTKAEWTVIIDYGSKAGFQCVGDARDYLLRKGRKQAQRVANEAADSPEGEPVAESSTTGSTPALVGTYVVAPCPHDGACPLHVPIDDLARRRESARLFKKGDYKGKRKMDELPRVTPTTSSMGPTSVCHFSQRLQRPQFTRLTKHAYKATEDMLYSYVVIRRGQRPTRTGFYDGEMEEETREWMLTGAVGREQAAKAQEKSRMEEGGSAVVLEDEGGELHFHRGSLRGAGGEVVAEPFVDHRTPEEERADNEYMRLDSYTWPRVIYPPLKRSGHVILDSCTADGNISRITIPRSQGKQPYYDARKSSWGDIFPHEPKNGLEIRKKGKGAQTEEQATAGVEDEEMDEAEDQLWKALRKNGGTIDLQF
ncbi:37S ribosomal protein S22 [Tulasnella sp. 408]|nr:37S ribosomal protein S22 [Tulasnella sp. 408]